MSSLLTSGPPSAMAKKETPAIGLNSVSKGREQASPFQSSLPFSSPRQGQGLGLAPAPRALGNPWASVSEFPADDSQEFGSTMHQSLGAISSPSPLSKAAQARQSRRSGSSISIGLGLAFGLPRKSFSQGQSGVAGGDGSGTAGGKVSYYSGPPPIPLVITQRNGEKLIGATDFIHRLDAPVALSKANARMGSLAGLPGATLARSLRRGSQGVTSSSQRILPQTSNPVNSNEEDSYEDPQEFSMLFSEYSEAVNGPTDPMTSSGRASLFDITSVLGDGDGKRENSIRGSRGPGATSRKAEGNTSTPTSSATQYGKAVHAGANDSTGKFLAQAIYTKESRRKGEAEHLFTLLDAHQQSRRCDVPLPNTQERARHHAKKNAGCVETVFKPACSLLTSLWDHFRVGKDERRRVAERLFLEPSQENYIGICGEIEKFTSRVVQTEDTLHLVNLRETLLHSLITRSRSPQLLESVKEAVQENHVVEIFNTVLLLRHTTCAIVDAVYDLRNKENRIKPLLWEGSNYLIKMQDDLSPLSDSHLPLLLPGMVFAGNPMLLPPRYFESATTPAPTSTTVSRDRAATPSFSSAGGAGGSRSSSKPSSPKGRAKTPSLGATLRGASTPALSNPALGNLQQPISETPTTNLTSASPIPLSFSPNRRGSHKKEVVLRDGEELVSVKTVTERQMYFRRKEKEDYIASRKVEMDRSNVYQYPASVYAPKPMPLWQITGKKLCISLDPELESAPYLDLIDYTKMQFGRLQAPPVFTDSCAWESCLTDVETKGYRPTAPVPHMRFNDLRKRELLIFAENSAMKRSQAQEKLRRGLLKFRMAQKGFFAIMRRNRARQADLQAVAMGRRSLGRSGSGIPTQEEMQEQEARRQRARGAQQFLEWVKGNAPDWLSEVGEQLTALTVTASRRRSRIDLKSITLEDLQAELAHSTGESEGSDSDYDVDDTWIL
jgi:hypothetical protein